SNGANSHIIEVASLGKGLDAKTRHRLLEDGVTGQIVVQEVIDVEPVYARDAQDYFATYDRVWAHSFLKQDGGFYCKVHGMVKDYADDPITIGSAESIIANTYVAGRISPCPTAISGEEKASILAFVAEKIAPELKRLMISPFGQLIDQAEILARQENRPDLL